MSASATPFGRAAHGRVGVTVLHRTGKALALLFVFALIGAACSKKTNTGTGSTGSTKSKTYTIGFTNPIASNDQLHTLQNAITARAEALGDKVIALDDNLDVNKQISDIDQLVAQHVDAIIVFPLDPKAITPAV